MKFSLAYVKQNPVMFGVIFIVFGLLLWLLINRGGAGSSSGTTVVNSGPSDAQVAMGTQLQMAQIQAGSAASLGSMQLEALGRQMETQYALAGLELQYSMAELGANERMSDKALEASLGALAIQMSGNLAMNDSNNQFMVDYARVAADSATTQIAINAALQRDMSRDQLEGFKFNSAISAIGTLKKKDRDNALAGFMNYSIPNDPQRSGGSGGVLSFVKAMVSPASALLK